jgi:DNA polymerase III delta prime subunit
MPYAEDVNIIGENLCIIEKIPEALLVSSKENVLELNADKTKYMIISLDYNAVRSKYIHIDDSSFERLTRSNMWKQPKQI